MALTWSRSIEWDLEDWRDQAAAGTPIPTCSFLSAPPDRPSSRSSRPRRSAGVRGPDGLPRVRAGNQPGVGHLGRDLRRGASQAAQGLAGPPAPGVLRAGAVYGVARPGPARRERGRRRPNAAARRPSPTPTPRPPPHTSRPHHPFGVQTMARRHSPPTAAAPSLGATRRGPPPQPTRTVAATPGAARSPRAGGYAPRTGSVLGDSLKFGTRFAYSDKRLPKRQESTTKRLPPNRSDRLPATPPPPALAPQRDVRRRPEPARGHRAVAAVQL